MNGKKDYYIGLDLGTNSVGWAVTDTDYKLLRAKGKDLWGVRLFDAAKPASKRRSQRIQRRRTEREKARKAMLRTYFVDTVDAVDPGFFKRLDESFLHKEDRSDSNRQKYMLFNDPKYTDVEYLEEFPTIFHLRQALLHDENRKFDVRLLYIAILNMFSHRGHFLNTNMSSDDEDSSFDDAWGELMDALTEVQNTFQEDKVDFSAITSLGDNKELKALLIDTGKKRTVKFEEFRSLLNVQKSNKQACAVLKMLCGCKVSVKDITYGIDDLNIESDSEKISFIDTDIDEKMNSILEILGEEWFEVLIKSKTLYDACLLASILGDNKYISDSGVEDIKYLSDSRVEMYKRHKQDLNDLKKLLKEYDQAAYRKIFRRIDEVGSYSAYVGSVYSYGKRTRRSVKNNPKTGTVKDKMYKAIKKVLERSVPDDNALKAQILDKIDRDCFLEKQINSNNGVIPNQVHAKELKRILSNASRHHEFLNEKDETGLSVSEKIIQLFEFQIPYYVGPLGREFNGKSGYNNWAVRTDAGKKPGVKITPWNFNEMIDLEASAEEFIKRMLRKCSYMTGEHTLPKQSLLYEKFMVLNEINNIKVDNVRLDVRAKHGIYNDLFRKGNKVKKKDIKGYLVKHCYMEEDSEISGLSEDTCTTKLSSLGKFKTIFGDDVDKQSNKEIIENIIYWSTIYSGAKKIIRQKIVSEYPDKFDDAVLKKILGFKFEGWGKLSKKFLEMQGASKLTGEIKSILGFMWDGQENLMELLSDNYTFMEEINKNVAESIKELSDLKIEDLDDIYLSPAVKRTVWQTIKIVDELRSVIGYDPKRIFVEVTRGEGDKKRTKSRKQKLIDLYKSIEGESGDWIKELSQRDKTEFKSRKLYLYYMQWGMCMYSGEKIELDNLMNDNLYDLDHIYPKHFTKDDSIENNLVLVKKGINNNKSDAPIPRDIQSKMSEKWKELYEKEFISAEKYARLTRRNAPFSAEEKAGFINRQLVETSQAAKAITRIFGHAFDKNTKIVFSKARLVSDFRAYFDIPKSRVLNCYHHANDAYLNIVVGNSYYVKFEGNPARFIKAAEGKPDDDAYKYHMTRFFEHTVKNKNEVAWRMEEDNKTIDIVRRTIGKYSPLISYKREEGKGAYFNDTIYPKVDKKSKNILAYTGIKTKDTPLSDVTKYGGKKSIATSGYCFVKYNEKNKEVRCFETLPVHLGNSRILTREIIEDYLKKHYLERGMVQALETYELLIEFIPRKTEILLDGHIYTIGGSSDDNIYINSIVQVKLPKKFVKYMHKLEKAKERDEYSEVDSKGCPVITKENNLETLDAILMKMETSAFKNKKNLVYNALMEGRDKFNMLDIPDQVSIILDTVNNLYDSSYSVNLSKIGGGSEIGVCRAGRKITNFDEIVLRFKSCTGLYVREIDLLKI